MSDSQTRREIQKHKLRRRIAPALDRETIEAERAALKKRRRRILYALLGILFLAGALYLVQRVLEQRTFSRLEPVAEYEAGGAAGYIALGKGYLRYSADGCEYMEDGRLLWNYGYSMLRAKALARGEYVLLWDANGTQAYVADRSGLTGSVTTLGPIRKAVMSVHGVSALMTEEDGGSMISFYDRAGNPLDIQIRNVLTETTGYPLDMAMSEAGTGMVLSLVYVTAGKVETRLSFLNFDVGKNNSDRVVGFFTYEDEIFPQLAWLGSSSAAAVGEHRVEFFSLANEASPALVKSVPAEQIESVFAGEDTLGLILTDEEKGRVLRIYTGAGELITEYRTDREYTDYDATGDMTVLYSSSECLVISREGHIRYDGATGSSVTGMLAAGRNRLLRFSDTGISEVKMR